MKTNIALIGFMGAGKSAAGRALAVKLGMEFIDLDTLIEEKTGSSIAGIFSRDGEAAFRRMEAQAAAQVAGLKEKVIACGGGVVLEQNNISLLRGSSIIVYLAAGPDILLRRVIHSQSRRPLLEVAGPAAAIDDLLKHRSPLYEKAADIIIDTSGLDIAGVAGRISEELAKNESFNLEKRNKRQG
jgi:shikimate kinase